MPRLSGSCKRIPHLSRSHFTAEEFANNTFFIGRSYNIIVPRVPITFNPSEEKQLREIEETNNIDSNSITKARWIKLTNRRRNGQTHAYATLTISSPSIANQLIRNGITICRATSPCKNFRVWHMDGSTEQGALLYIYSRTLGPLYYLRTITHMYVANLSGRLLFSDV